MSIMLALMQKMHQGGAAQNVGLMGLLFGSSEPGANSGLDAEKFRLLLGDAETKLYQQTQQTVAQKGQDAMLDALMGKQSGQIWQAVWQGGEDELAALNAGTLAESLTVGGADWQVQALSTEELAALNVNAEGMNAKKWQTIGVVFDAVELAQEWRATAGGQDAAFQGKTPVGSNSFLASNVPIFAQFSASQRSADSQIASAEAAAIQDGMATANDLSTGEVTQVSMLLIPAGRGLASHSGGVTADSQEIEAGGADEVSADAQVSPGVYWLVPALPPQAAQPAQIAWQSRVEAAASGHIQLEAGDSQGALVSSRVRGKVIEAARFSAESPDESYAMIVRPVALSPQGGQAVDDLTSIGGEDGNIAGQESTNPLLAAAKNNVPTVVGTPAFRAGQLLAGDQEVANDTFGDVLGDSVGVQRETLREADPAKWSQLAQQSKALPTPVEQVQMHLRQAVSSGTDRIQMHLYPEELGPVEVRMETRDGELRLHIIADRPEALDLLQRDSRELARNLQQIGFKTDESGLQFSLRGEGGSSWAQHSQQGEQGDQRQSRNNQGSAWLAGGGDVADVEPVPLRRWGQNNVDITI